jgi:hypothetical protein
MAERRMVSQPAMVMMYTQINRSWLRPFRLQTSAVQDTP